MAVAQHSQHPPQAQPPSLGAGSLAGRWPCAPAAVTHVAAWSRLSEVHSRGRLSSRCSQYCFSGFGTGGLFFQREHRPIWGCPGEPAPRASVNPRPPTVALLLRSPASPSPLPAPLPFPRQPQRQSFHVPLFLVWPGWVWGSQHFVTGKFPLHWSHSYTVCWYATVQAEWGVWLLTFEVVI